MDEHMVTDFSAIDDNKSAFRSSYFIHSNKRDLSFTPGLKSSLLKPSLLVNGSMPILKFVLRIASDHNTAGFKDTWHSLTSCHFPLADGIYVCLLMRFQLALPQVSQDHVLRDEWMNEWWMVPISSLAAKGWIAEEPERWDRTSAYY